MSYSVAKMPREIIIGRETENGVTQIRFDVSPWLEKWPGMSVSMIAKNPEDTVYIASTGMDGNDLVWTITNADTAVPGKGSIEIAGTLDDKKKVSAASDTRILRRIEGTAGEPPQAAAPWVDKVLQAGEQAMTAVDKMPVIGANGNWQTWNADANAYQDSGIKAIGEDGSMITNIYESQKPLFPGQGGKRRYIIEVDGKPAYAFDLYDGQKGAKGDTGATGPAGADGVSPTVTTSKSGKVTTITIKDAAGTKTATINDGADGAKGDPGEPGTPGKDAVVDTTLTQSGQAADAKVTGDALACKLTEPSTGLAVGKYFRIAAIDENGHAVLEAVDAPVGGVQDVQVAGASVVADGVANVPLANAFGKYGVVNLSASGGVKWSDALNALSIDFAREPAIAGRSSSNNPLIPYYLDYAVKAAMCDGKGAAWTADEQAAARERMGIYNYNKIAVITLAEDSAPIIDLGAEYIKLFIVFTIPAGDTCISKNYIRNQDNMSIAFFPSNTVFYSSARFATSIIDKNGEYWTCDTNYGSNNSAAHSGSNRSAYKLNSDTITKIQFGDPIRAGSEIQIYGVRA